MNLSDNTLVFNTSYRYETEKKYKYTKKGQIKRFNKYTENLLN